MGSDFRLVFRPEAGDAGHTGEIPQFFQEFLDPARIPQQEPVRKIHAFVALMRTLAGALDAQAVPVKDRRQPSIRRSRCSC